MIGSTRAGFFYQKRSERCEQAWSFESELERSSRGNLQLAIGPTSSRVVRMQRKKMSDMRWGSASVWAPVILFCAIELLHLSQGNAALVPEEENALEILRQKFNQPGWTGDACKNVAWITCSNDSLHILELSLPNEALKGTIPSELGELRHIRAIFLNSNNFTGPIPDLSNLTELTNIDLKYNDLSGPILNTTSFVNLTRLVLFNNQLTGGIPADVFQHPKLELLYLDNNALGGSLPDMSQLTSMKELSLININLSGTIPQSILNMTRTTHIILEDNPGLEGPLPNMSVFADLKFLKVKNCALNGSIPDLKFAPDMQQVDLQHNDFSGEIPPALFEHEQIKYLNLNNNSKISGEIPDTGGLRDVLNFFVNDCNLTGPVPSFQNNVQLQYIAMENNKLTTCPSEFPTLTNMVLFKVSNNSISGSLPEFAPNKNALYLIFSHNRFSGEIPKNWTGLTALEKIKLDYNNLSGVLPKEIGNLKELDEILLNNNRFSGSIPKEFGQLTMLTTLDLSNNNFSGVVPDELANLPKLQKLSLENNSLDGIPEALIKRRNDGLLNLTYDSTVPIISNKSGTSVGAIVGIVIGVVAFVALSAVIAVLFLRRNKKKMTHYQLSKDDLPESTQAFSRNQIKAITSNYKTVIGKGGFGTVYYGKLADGREVAVKIKERNSSQGAGEFLNEVQLLSRLHHRNIVPLVGYSLEGRQQTLVYVYMAQGTLHDHLYHTGSKAIVEDTSESQHLSWKTRLQIAIDAAKGLEYLHKDCNPPVIHRDVKASNILLNEKFQAKVSDLGISKQDLEKEEEEEVITTGISTAVKGTFGYLDPEYFIRRILTTKSDVYSFGVLLLEIITRRSPVGSQFPGNNDTTLIEWVKAAVKKDQIDFIVDPALGMEYCKEGMLKIVNTALSCVHPESGKRPDMTEILISLTEALKLENESVIKTHTPKMVPDSGHLNDPVGQTKYGQSSYDTEGPHSSFIDSYDVVQYSDQLVR